MACRAVWICTAICFAVRPSIVHAHASAYDVCKRRKLFWGAKAAPPCACEDIIFNKQELEDPNAKGREQDRRLWGRSVAQPLSWPFRPTS